MNISVPYSQSGKRDGYRPDCSGFISYAWQLQKDGKPFSFDTVELGKKWTVKIPFEDLQAGDIINNNKSGNFGHVVMFVSWRDDNHTQFNAYEENADPNGDGNYNDGRAIQSIRTLDLDKMSEDGYPIKEFIGGADGPFYAQRIIRP